MYIKFTSTSVEFGDSGHSDDYLERHGWVNPYQPHTQFNHAHNVVSFNYDDPDMTPDEWIEHMAATYLGVPYEDNGDGTYYATDVVQDSVFYEHGINTTLAMHVIDK